MLLTEKVKQERKSGIRIKLEARLTSYCVEARKHGCCLSPHFHLLERPRLMTKVGRAEVEVRWFEKEERKGPSFLSNRDSRAIADPLSKSPFSGNMRERKMIWSMSSDQDDFEKKRLERRLVSVGHGAECIVKLSNLQTLIGCSLLFYFSATSPIQEYSFELSQ